MGRTYTGNDSRPQDAVGVFFVDALGNATGGNYTPRGDQQFTIAQLQAKQTLTVPTGATVAIMQNNTTVALRWRDGPSGADPTTTVGQRIIAGDTLNYDGNLAQFEIIAEGTGTGTLDIWYGS